MSTRLIFVRHGESMCNKAKCFTGQMDVALSSLGVLQAKRVCEYIKDNFSVDKIYSSDLIRAVNTIRPLSKSLGLEIITTKKLRETDVGLWQGLTRVEVEQKFPESFAKFNENLGLCRFDGGETYMDVQKRALEAVKEILNESKEKCVAVALHAGTLKTILCGLDNKDTSVVSQYPAIKNCSITVIDFDEKGHSIEKIGFAEHLENIENEVGKEI